MTWAVVFSLRPRRLRSYARRALGCGCDLDAARRGGRVARGRGESAFRARHDRHGDDAIAVKSGWDHGRVTADGTRGRAACECADCAGARVDNADTVVKRVGDD